MSKYQFIGDGTGIPGLPHEIDDVQAKAWADDHKTRAANLKKAGLDENHIRNRLASHPHVQFEAAKQNGSYTTAGKTASRQKED